MKKVKLVILTLLVGLLFTGALFACDKTVEINFIVDNKVYSTFLSSKNASIEMPDPPSKEDFVFEGWYLDKDKWEIPFTEDYLNNNKITKDIKVYARWRAAKNVIILMVTALVEICLTKF